MSFLSAISIAFQLSGAVILLLRETLWSIQKQIDDYSGTVFIESEALNLPNVLPKGGPDKKPFQIFASKIIISRIAFVYLILGYLLAVFESEKPITLGWSLIVIIVGTVVFLGVGYCIARRLSKCWADKNA